MPLRLPDGSERFLQLTSGLGVVDVRATESACVYVVATSDTDDERMDEIRILARIEWPDRPIVIGRRSPIRESGRQARFKNEDAPGKEHSDPLNKIG